MSETVKTKGRIVYIEPNDLVGLSGVNSVNGKTYGEQGFDSDNIFWNAEDLNMSVDLQVVMPNREDCGQVKFNETFLVTINNDLSSDVGRYVSFMSGSDMKVKQSTGNNFNTEHELTTSYIEASYQELYSDGKSNKESLGIESIDITFDQHFYPQVNIKFIDVRGYSLMMPKEEEFRNTMASKEGKEQQRSYSNFFRALFHFPYPRFLLTIKGYYGNSITFILAVNEFKSNFNSQTGNFEVNVSFIGYMYGLYTDLPFNFLLCAPYYGSNIDNGHATGPYWGDYYYDDGKGNEQGRIVTFIDFIEKCDRLNEAKNKIERYETNSDTINKSEKLNEEKEKLNSIFENIQKLTDNISQDQENDDLTIIKETDSKNNNLALMILSKNKGAKLKYSDLNWSKIVDDLESLSTLSISNQPQFFYNSETKKYIKTPEITISEDGYYTLIGHSIKENGNGVHTVCNSLSELKKQFPNIANQLAIKSERYYYSLILNFGGILEAINGRISDINTQISGSATKLIDDMQSLYTESLGFNPTIQNIYRMIFAHIDCFMKGFYDLLFKIKKENRKLKDIGISDRNLTDLNKNATSECFVPPFTAFYKIEDNKRVEIYPNDIGGIKMLEVDYIENLLSGVLSAKNSVLQYLAEAQNRQGFVDEINNANKISDNNFIPTSVIDYTYNGVNPYVNFTENPNDDSFLGDLIYFFILRYAQSNVQHKKLVENIATAEAENFSKVHKNVPSENFKKLLESVNSNDTALKELIKKAINNRGLLGNPSHNSSTGLIMINNPPYLFNSIKSSGSDNVFITSKATDKRLFDIWDSDRLTDVQKYHDSIPEDSKLKERIRTSSNDYMLGENGKFENKLTKLHSNENTDGSVMFAQKLNNMDTCRLFLGVCQNTYVKNIYIGQTIMSTAGGYQQEIPSNVCNISNIGKKTYISAYHALSLLYCGAMAYNDIRNNKKTNEISEKDQYGITYNGYKTIYSNVIVRKKLISYFQEFAMSGAWQNLKNLVCNKNNYTYVSKTESYEMNSNVTNAVFNFANKLVYLIDINNDNNGASVKIPFSECKTFITALYNVYNNGLSNNKQMEMETRIADITDSYRLATYNTLKNLYDKWANSYTEEDFILRNPSDDMSAKKRRYENDDIDYSNGTKEFDNFLFIDSYYNDISSKFKINPQTIYDLVVSQINSETNYSTYEFMADICQKNRLLFLALPVYNNMYSVNGIKNIFNPQINQTMKVGYGSTYVCMYTYEVSHVIEDESDSGMCDDGFDIAAITEGSAPQDVINLFAGGSEDSSGLSLKVPAFGVTYAMQNQQYFKSININMDNPRVTDYSIANLFQLANYKGDGSLEKPNTVANDVYSIYANRSYNCNVEMMGCANIMPMMYFQLNNIPMFRGAYMIANVEHHIRPGSFTTTFSGVRISKNQLPYNDMIFNLGNLLNLEGGMAGRYELSTIENVNVECTNFSVKNAIARMHSSVSHNGKTAVPYTNRDSKGNCAFAVGEFVSAGLGTKHQSITNDGKGNQNPLIGFQKGVLAKLGFKLILTIPSGTTLNERKKITSTKCIAGDIAVMSRPDKTSGHSCMYDGNVWISDFNQGVNVYPYKQGGPNSTPIYICRHTGCKVVNKNITNPNCNNGNFYPSHGHKPKLPTTTYKLFGLTGDNEPLNDVTECCARAFKQIFSYIDGTSKNCNGRKVDTLYGIIKKWNSANPCYPSNANTYLKTDLNQKVTVNDKAILIKMVLIMGMLESTTNLTEYVNAAYERAINRYRNR